MRGEVLHYDEAQGFGFITGADGGRYTFARENLRRAGPIAKGTDVEFQASGGQARDVFAIREPISRTAAHRPASPGPVGSSPPGPPQSVPPGRLQAETAPFGRHAADRGLESTGLFAYFWRALTVNYANFRDRARRKEYWGFALFVYLGLALASLAGLAIDHAVGNMGSGGDSPVLTVAFPVVAVLATIVPWIAISVRRQHDIGLSGWFYLLIFLPYIGGLILFVFSLIPSQAHENRWGPVPNGVRTKPPFTPQPGSLQ